jgi:hypothetical protein
MPRSPVSKEATMRKQVHINWLEVYEEALREVDPVYPRTVKRLKEVMKLAGIIEVPFIKKG